MERQLIHVQYPIWDGDTHVHTLELYSLLAAPLRDALHQIRDHYGFTNIINLGLDHIKVDLLSVYIGKDALLPQEQSYDNVRLIMTMCGFEEINNKFILKLIL